MRLTKGQIESLFEQDFDAVSRTIWMGHIDDDGDCGINASAFRRFSHAMHLLELVSKKRPITVILSGGGGDAMAGRAIYDRIRESPARVTIKGYGDIASAHSIIFQAGDRRLMAPNGVQLLHYGSVSADTSSKSFQNWGDEQKRLDEWTETVYWNQIRCRQPNFSLQTVKDMLSHDTFLPAERCLELGLCDGIIR